MKIGVLGAGAMADALGTRWAAAGHELMVAGRSAHKAEALARRWGGRTGTFPEVAEFAEVALIAVHYQGMASTLGRIGDSLRGTPIVDCNNPVEVEHFTLVTDPGRSMAQDIERSTGGHVVKAFNLCEAGVWRMAAPMFDGRRLAVPYCGDDPAAMNLVQTLITDLGALPLPVGDLQQAHHLEAMAAVVISLLFGGRHPSTTFNLVDAAGDRQGR